MDETFLNIMRDHIGDLQDEPFLFKRLPITWPRMTHVGTDAYFATLMIQRSAATISAGAN